MLLAHSPRYYHPIIFQPQLSATKTAKNVHVLFIQPITTRNRRHCVDFWWQTWDGKETEMATLRWLDVIQFGFCSSRLGFTHMKANNSETGSRELDSTRDRLLFGPFSCSFWRKVWFNPIGLKKDDYVPLTKHRGGNRQTQQQKKEHRGRKSKNATLFPWGVVYRGWTW